MKFHIEKSRYKRNKASRIVPKFILISLGPILGDWRITIKDYLRDPSAKANKSDRQSAFKFVLHNNELYRRAAKYLLLKGLDSDQAKMAMGEVQESIYVVCINQL
jgi:hypothetical protein